MAELGRYALVVSSSRYADPSLRPLTAPTEDAEALTELLRNPAIGGFRVREIVDQPSWVVAENVERFFAERRLNDIALFYFSGHGIKDEDGRLYFAAMNTDPQLLRSTAVRSDDMVAAMSQCRSRQQVLLLDCCFAGAFARAFAKGDERVGVQERFATEGAGRVVITASDSMQVALEGGRIQGEPSLSVFTRALVEGIETGEADQNADGYVSLDELYDYVYERVRRVNPNQTPTTSNLERRGEIVLAFNPKAEPAAGRPPRRGVAKPPAKPQRTPPRKQNAVDATTGSPARRHDTPAGAAPKRKPKSRLHSAAAKRMAAGATDQQREVLRQLAQAEGVELSHIKRHLDLLSQNLKADEELLGACQASDWAWYGVLAVTSRRLLWVRGIDSGPKVGELSYDQIFAARTKRTLVWRKLVVSATPKDVEFVVEPKDRADSLATLINERATG